MSVLAPTRDFTHRRAPRATRHAGLFHRLLDSYRQWRLRRVEQDIAIRLGLTGGHLTDEIERRMTERLVSGGGFRG